MGPCASSSFFCTYGFNLISKPVTGQRTPVSQLSGTHAIDAANASFPGVSGKDAFAASMAYVSEGGKLVAVARRLVYFSPGPAPPSATHSRKGEAVDKLYLN